VLEPIILKYHLSVTKIQLSFHSIKLLLTVKLSQKISLNSQNVNICRSTVFRAILSHTAFASVLYNTSLGHCSAVGAVSLEQLCLPGSHHRHQHLHHSYTKCDDVNPTYKLTTILHRDIDYTHPFLFPQFFISIPTHPHTVLLPSLPIPANFCPINTNLSVY